MCNSNEVSQVFRPRTPSEAVDLVGKLLEYTPESRLSAIEAMCHPFFDELRVEGQRMPNGKDFPPLFDFTREGMCRYVLHVLPALILSRRTVYPARPDATARATTLRAGARVAGNTPGVVCADTARPVANYAGLTCCAMCVCLSVFSSLL